MKHMLWTLLLTVSLPCVAGLALPDTSVAATRPDLKAVALALSEATLHIPGMTCSNRSCATTVYMALIRLPGVMGVGVDESTQTVVVKYIASRTKPSVFLAAVKNAGFPGILVKNRA